MEHFVSFGTVKNSSRSAFRGVYALALVLVVTTAGCKGDYSGAAAPPGGPNATPKEVSLVQVEQRPIAETIVGNGTLAADEDAALAFKVPGRIVDIKVDLGTNVHKGDVVARLDTTDYDLKLSQAEAALQQARVRLGLDPTGASDRVDIQNTGTVRQAKAVLDEAAANRVRGEKLAASGVISKAELDAYESNFRVADAKYQDALEEVRNRQAVLLQRSSEREIARQQLTDTTLRAPFDGAVSERVSTVGEYVAAGARVATLVRLHPLRLRAEIPEREAIGVEAGQSVVVKAEGFDGTASGRVARMSPVVNQQNRVLVFEIEVDNIDGKLKPGGFARAEIATNRTAEAVTVPATAVVTFAGIEKVFIVKDGKAAERNVTTGRHVEDRIEITSGLTPADSVVAEPGTLAAGQPVVVK